MVGDQPNIQREMEGSDEGEVSLKEVKDKKYAIKAVASDR